MIVVLAVLRLVVCVQHHAVLKAEYCSYTLCCVAKTFRDIQQILYRYT
jgi:hypothetical protein